MQVDQTSAQLAGMTLEEGKEAKKAEEGVSRDGPIVMIVMGMAGSGKTTFVHVSVLDILSFP